MGKLTGFMEFPRQEPPGRDPNYVDFIDRKMRRKK